MEQQVESDLTPPVNRSEMVVPYRRRPDLLMTRSRFEGRVYCVIKDPVSLRYFRFQPIEHRLLELIDGRRTVAEIIQQFEKEFAPEKLSEEELFEFLNSMSKEGLLLANTRSEGERLYQTATAKSHYMGRQKWSNFLFIKLPGFDPEPSLNWLYPKMKWLFSFWGMFFSVLFMLSAAFWVTLKFDEFTNRPELERFQTFFNLENVVWLWLAIGVSKVIHEYGHGLSCKHFGGECHDMGVLLLIFTPCFYCNVSDSWMNNSRWSRMFVCVAGIYVELMLASIATFVWWFSQPGVVHNIAFATMFYCSLNTILVNANPLLRYDGYYVMVDLLETPNLMQKSNQLMQFYIYKLIFGIEIAQPAMLPQKNRRLFVAYAIAAYLYRFLVLFVILWFLYNVLQPYKLGVISYILGSIALGKLILAPMWTAAVTVAKHPDWRRNMNPGRVAVSAGIITTLIVAAFVIPLPKRVSAQFTVAHLNEQTVSAPMAGSVEEILVSPGKEVNAGDPLIKLKNFDVEQQILQSESALKSIEIERQVNIELGDDARAKLLAEQFEEQKELLENRQKKQRQLVVKAPADGVVIPATTRNLPKVDRRKINKLEPWQGHLLKTENKGAYVESGTSICLIGDPESFQAVLLVPQSDLEYIEQGQYVRLSLDAFPTRQIRGKVKSIGYGDVSEVPPQLSNRTNGGIPARPTAIGTEEPMDSHYQILVEFNEEVPAHLLKQGLRGRAKIHCGTVTPREWAWRLISETIRF